MGLSDEERLTKFFWAMQGWRKKLCKFADSFKQGDTTSMYTSEKKRDVVRGWVRELDRLVGLCLRKTDFSSAYWLMGPNEDSFAGLMGEAYSLDVDASPDSYAHLDDPERLSVRWWLYEADYAEAADRLQRGRQKHDGLRELAAWWDCYSYFAAVMYPVWRYQDAFFPAGVRGGLTRLVGEMVNRRFEVSVGDYNGDAARMERYLLLKHRAVVLLLEKESNSRHGDAYFREEFDGSAVYEKVAGMSAKDLKSFFDEESKRKWEWDKEYREGEMKKSEEKPDGLFGPPVKRESEGAVKRESKSKKGLAKRGGKRGR